MELLIYSIIGLVVGVILFILSFSHKKLYKTILNLPTSKVRSIAMGLVELFGKVVANQKKAITSPFLEQKCVFSRWDVAKWVKTKNGGHWSTIKKGLFSDYFYLNDGTGYVLVDPKKAKVDIPISYEHVTRNPSARLIRIMTDNLIFAKTFFGFYPKLRFREFNLLVGKDVFILGTAVDNPYVEDGSALYNHQDIMIKKGKMNGLFYITCDHEKKILQKLKWKIFFFQYGGIALILFGLVVIFYYIGWF